MTLTELRYILAVARERHFGRAAEYCHVSQPSLSVAVKKLEDELQVKIFERRSNDVTLTPTGAAIVEEAKQILARCDKLRECAAQGRDPLTGSLRLGVIYTIAPYLVPQLVSSIHSIVPMMPLILSENYTSVLLDQLKNGQIDCAIMALPISQPGLMMQPLYDEDFVAPITPSAATSTSCANNSKKNRCCCSVAAIASAIKFSTSARILLARTVFPNVPSKEPACKPLSTW